MSNPKDSPVIDSTVVKKGAVATASKTVTTPKTEDKDNSAHYDSIAELKQATDIVDAVGKPVQETAESDQAAKKAKLKDQLISEAKELEQNTTVESVNKAAKSSAADTDKDSQTTDTVDADKKASAKPDSNSNDDKQLKKASNSKEEPKPAEKAEPKPEQKDDSKQQKTTATDSSATKRSTEESATDKSTAAKSPAPKKSTAKVVSGQHRVAILGGNRIPFARSNGAYSEASNTDMLTAAFNGLIERYNLQDELLGEVVAGAVIKLSRDINLTREAALNTALNPQTPAYDISQACGTGVQATFASANKIALGIIDSAITGGVDTTSDAPIAIGDGLRKVLLKLGSAKNMKQRLQALSKFDPKDLIDAPQNGEPRTGLSMGDHQAITTLEWNISREDQDELAFNSHKNLARAYDEGFFDDLLTPYKGLTRDNNLRPDSTIEKLGKLKPAFGKNNANPTMTAANSTPLTDGASCVLLSNEDWAKERGLKPLAYIVHQETAAVDFIGKSGDKEGLLMAPAYAVPRMLERAGLTLQDFDFYEIHEAFASQVLSTMAAWEDESFCKQRLGLDAPLGSIDRSKLNVNGSSLAAGHPFAATGGRILATAAKLLDQKGSGRALISICAAGGQGVTCILEK
ncbi:acetyl-CoA C-acetyltransferase [Psychrobacter sp. BF1]|uniref:acetyl-CoA C-acetyltransferase n=1 Tax=Psychrobacter sp. BF1 TaxID=2821147 RepID=UPI002119C83E|nr:acetyl-CoA C-acetyltransferase [Psychrobacter sp. BF1]